MALSQADRLSISGKIVAIPAQNAQAAQSSASIQVAVTAAQSTDTANKNLMNVGTPTINAYQGELENLNGDGFSQLTEQNIQDGANRVVGNFFFLNQPTVPTPHAPDGLWKFFTPFLYSAAVGAAYNEGYATFTNETTLIASMQAAATTLGTFPLIERVTGESCTSGSPDVIAPDAPIQTAMTTLVNGAASLVTALGLESAALTSNPDTNPTNVTQNTTAQSNISTFLSALTAWQAVQTFNTSFSATTCVVFNALNPVPLEPTKGDTTHLANLVSAMTARSSFLTTRIAQIQAILGTVTQSSTDGSILTATGLYGSRARVIAMRLNAVGGSLSTVISLQAGQGALAQQQAANNNAAAVYASVMFATTLSSPTNGTAYVNVTSASGLSPGALVYVASNAQPEMQAYVKAVNGTQVLLDRPVPPTYAQSDYARIYIDLTA